MIRPVLLLLLLGGCWRSRTDEEALLRLCGLPSGSKVRALRAAPAPGGWQREGLTISATIEPPVGWNPRRAGYLAAPFDAERDVTLRRFPSVASALFDEASWLRCMTAGNDMLHATTLSACAAKPALLDVVVCSVRQTSVQVEVRASY